ncbi:zinc finger MYM-type protein 5-like [Brachypodium distachyon]|uniref:zinc finger MYM-type protein 5-like n=1 Tax=Brachypodium distachyon TaxID=15368 RepID=UPI000D0CFCF2|nr:zinc finger MYM-type protein 5-like [Brachypodium distachyon]|eukprot:XP_024310359.1 zinc finger MYM-type protein 5-like [Brachypodium distachyon]
MAFRKYESGAQKHKKKEREQGLIQSHKWPMDRFIVKETQVSSTSVNQSVDPSILTIDNNGPACTDPRDGQTEIIEDNDEAEEVHIDDNLNTSHAADVNDSFQPDIFDPRYWDSLDPKQIDILVQKGPKRDLSIKKGPKDNYSRRSSAPFYTRFLSNGEQCDRDWLVYSKELNRVFWGLGKVTEIEK